MMRLSLSNLAATFAALALLPNVAYAHFIWATVENGQARFALLDNVSAAPEAQFVKYVADLTPRSGTKKLSLGAPINGARFATLPVGQNVVYTTSVVGARERDGEKYLLVYHAKGTASLAAAATDTEDSEEILARRDSNQLVLSVRQGTRPVTACEVWVQFPGDENPTSVQTDVKGEARVALPQVESGGFVGVRAMIVQKKAGENGGKKYDSIHHWATLTFPTPVTVVQKPFTQILRASYGNNHEIVSNTAFNKTLFDGKLTLAQLTVHLQQRALVHNELHRILIGANAVKPLPYGAEQKNVLTLLFADLISIGSGWPTEAQARPLTKAFLQEIRDSESRGGYFALGVQHVYFGGITNGGRMIGEKIGETLHFTPTYYEKSDGYTEYLEEVNKITDPQARSEMIRGGQAAYRYIIDSSNEDVFKSP